MTLQCTRGAQVMTSVVDYFAQSFPSFIGAMQKFFSFVFND
jgi:hypothetical protein